MKLSKPALLVAVGLALLIAAAVIWYDRREASYDTTCTITAPEWQDADGSWQLSIDCE